MGSKVSTPLPGAIDPHGCGLGRLVALRLVVIRIRLARFIGLRVWREHRCLHVYGCRSRHHGRRSCGRGKAWSSLADCPNQTPDLYRRCVVACGRRRLLDVGNRTRTADAGRDTRRAIASNETYRRSARQMVRCGDTHRARRRQSGVVVFDLPCQGREADARPLMWFRRYPDRARRVNRLVDNVDDRYMRSGLSLTHSGSARIAWRVEPFFCPHLVPKPRRAYTMRRADGYPPTLKKDAAFPPSFLAGRSGRGVLLFGLRRLPTGR